MTCLKAAASAVPAAIRTIVYVDGFNLYYGIRRNPRNKWLDINKLCELLLNGPKRKHLIEIKYFTARIKKADPSSRQNVYLRAIETHCKVQIIYGRFAYRKKSAKLVTPIADKKWINVYATEEKGSDVNLAVHMVNDCYTKDYDCAVLISNDSDLELALKTVGENKKMIGLFTPNARSDRIAIPSRLLSTHAHFLRDIGSSVLEKSQLPDRIPGTKLTRPESWS